MLAIAFFSHHVEGSIYFMLPLTIAFALNLGIFLYLIVRKKYQSVWVHAYKHISLFTFMFGVFGTLVGFLQMFGALESMSETLPLSVISGGVKAALLNVLYGSGYFCLMQLGYLALHLANRTINE